MLLVSRVKGGCCQRHFHNNHNNTNIRKKRRHVRCAAVFQEGSSQHTHTHTHSHLLLSDHKQGCKIASHYTHPANRHPDSRSHTPTMTAKWVARPPQYASLHTSHAHMSGVQGRDRFHLWRHCTCIWRLLHAHGDMSGRTSVPGSKQKAHCGGAESDSDVHSEERSVAEHIAETVCCFTMRWSSWIYFGYR